MDKRPFKILGLKTMLGIRRLEVIFSDFGLVGNIETRMKYITQRVAQLDRTNKETCLTIANLYEELGNKKMSQKYWDEAKKYSHIII